MKNKLKKIILMSILGVSLFALPKDTYATTLKQYEDQVAKYTAELQEKQNKIAKNDAEVAQIKKRIVEIENQIKSSEDEIDRLQDEIVASNKKIAKKKEESKKIMRYFQVVNGENTYLEYIFGAKSITDMIYRMSVVEQLAEYNQQVVKELNKLIVENNQKKSDLQVKKQELNKLNANLQDQKERIEEDTKNVEGTVPSTKGQIAQYAQLVTYYKNKGCKSNDVIGVTCAVPPKVTPSSNSSASASAIIGANGFRFPVVGGHVSQGYGVNGHRGVDIGKGFNAEIYPVAAGEVFYVGNDLDNNHAYMVMIVHNYNGKLVFSQYAHVQPRIPVSVGQTVGLNTVIAYMGSTGYSTGPHLHLEMSTGCGWGYLCKYNNYLSHITNPFNYIPRP